MNTAILSMNLVVWLALGIVTVWRLFPLLTGTGRGPGRVMVFVLFLTSFLSNTFGLPPVARALDGIADGLDRVLLNLALIAAFFNFIYFFAAQLPRRELFIRTWFQGMLGVLAGAVMVTCAVVSPIGVPRYSALPDYGATAAFLFYVLGSVYFAYACVMVIWLGFRTAALPDVSQPWAFRTCAIGTTLVLLGGPVLRTTSILLRWSTAGAVTVPDWIEGTGQTVLTVGILGYVVGLCAIGARTLIAKTRVNIRLRRDYRVLRTLWTALHEAFPAIGFRPVGGLAGRMGLRRLGIGYRYRRRIIECRDGLWRLSPYVADPDDESDTLSIAAQAELVHEALRRVGDNTADPVAEPVAIAAPAKNRSDDTRLLALASAFREIAQPRSGQTASAGVESPA